MKKLQQTRKKLYTLANAIKVCKEKTGSSINSSVMNRNLKMPC